MLATGVNVNKKDNYEFFSLYTACYHNNIECVKMLIKNGADVNECNNRGGFFHYILHVILIILSALKY